jgi:D-proline reductase (dithiol) PrdB
MPRLDRLPQTNRNNLLAFPAQVNDAPPFTVSGKPLAASRLAIVTTAGLHRRADRLFGPGDQTYRMIPADTPSADGRAYSIPSTSWS